MSVRRVFLIVLSFILVFAVANGLSKFLGMSFSTTLISMGSAVGLSFLVAYTIEKYDERR